MAFSPLHSFRKHQKVIFAALTILCMVTFVLSFGRGDPLERLSMAFGGRGRDQPLATLYGRDIPRHEIYQLRDRRQLANQFMELALQSAHAHAIGTLADASSRWEEPQRKQAQTALNQLQQILYAPSQYAQYRFFFIQQILQQQLHPLLMT